MISNRTCSHQEAANLDLCPVCLLQLGLDAARREGASLNPGDRIGRYLLLEQIGEGGCGIVFKAEQTEPVRRLVALKVIKPGMDTRQVMARFEAERQALALLEHPNIAKIFDAGETESGRPYFVMELVSGERITDHCDRKKLSLQQRIGLFLQVCNAVHHAHQKGIIHRDLKPSNVLIRAQEPDDLGVPVIIDFGIAKSVEQPLTEKTLITAHHQFLGTPASMSPEQAGAGAVDARSDIYALGVLLYELLAGVTPFDATELRHLAPDEVLRFIRTAEPSHASARIEKLPKSQLIPIASHRQTEATRLASLLRGDFDCVLLKCLEKDPARRYETAFALALDLDRHLAHEPIKARPQGNWYRFEKMVRRNPAAAFATAAIALVLILATAVSAFEAVQAIHAQHATQVEARKNAEVARFLTELLRGAAPSVALGRDTTMLREILDSSAERLDTDLKDEPEAQAELFSTLAESYHQLGLFDKMEAMARASLQRCNSNEVNIRVVKALAQIGDAKAHLGKLDDAERFTREALAMRQKLAGDDEPRVAGLTSNLGLILRDEGRLREAETLLRDALQMD